MSKDDVNIFLKDIDLSFSDLVVDKVIKERQMDGTKSAKGEDISYLLERTIYKPLKSVRFQKIKSIYDRDWKPEKEKDTFGFTSTSFKIEDLKLSINSTQEILDIFIKLGLVIRINENDFVRYEFIDEELQHYIASLINLSQYKWSFIQHPQIEYFRKPKIDEKKFLKKIYKDKINEQLKKEIEKKKRQDEEYKTYKIRQKGWKKFKDENNLNVKNFKKNSLNYRQISRNWHSGLYKEIKDNWGREYLEEGQFDIMNKDGTQVIDRVLLLEYLHELNSDFKLWKQRFKGKKLDEVKKLAKQVFNRPKRHFLDMQKKWLKKSKREYVKMLDSEKERFTKIRRKYCYLNHALKLINIDFFKSKPDLD